MRHSENNLTSVMQLFERVAQSYPSFIAVEHNSHSITYRELDIAVNNLAEFLLEKKIKQGDLIPIISDRSIQSIVAILAVLKIGAVYVPVSGEWSPSKIEYVLQKINPEYVLLDGDYALSFLPSEKIISLSALRVDFVSDQKSGASVSIPAESLAYIIFTSGTTGSPKGVMVTHGSLLHVFFSWENAYQLMPGARHLQMASFSFDVFTGDWVRALCSGGTLVILPKSTYLNAKDLYHFIEQDKIYFAEFVPSVLNNLTDYLRQKNRSISTIDILVCGSDLWTFEKYQLAKNCFDKKTKIINSYGATEATIDSSYFYEIEPLLIDQMNAMPIGRPFAHADFYILDDVMRILPPGEVGEICIGGPALAVGYFQQEELTKAKFLELTLKGETKRIYRTGDRGYFSDQGDVHFLARDVSVIKVDGHRVDLMEVESILKPYEKIKDCIVCCELDKDHKFFLVCYLVLHNNNRLAYREIMSYIRARLPACVVPKVYRVVDQILVTENGKVDRNTSSYGRYKELLPEEESVLLDGVERRVVQVWNKVLRSRVFSRDEDFFEIGGDSIGLCHLLEMLKKEFNCSLELNHKNPITVFEIANQIKTHTGEAR